ncbi:hypothetical protein ENUP19_0047G0131 [Entamoeba nuttalli]|uniref:Uncharacterized protein n=2 Tax=Entamoeba nuttalli TaxID=412467 RepID=K2GWQ5_ENTNP|nr:hypothetical protein ENU1_173610 [Entamoeba nuttalli P19]EKE38202.1 hypothetical protein ENU1_173610 [Entamoeba nuttalli P19]|eukprot:XP_008859470.1 hypothetical protein ENU1_173610 [Entamoeba nuttalli P19]
MDESENQQNELNVTPLENFQLPLSQQFFLSYGDITLSESSATQLHLDDETLNSISPINLRPTKNVPITTEVSSLYMNNSSEDMFDPKVKRKLSLLELKFQYTMSCHEIHCLKKIKKTLSKTTDPFLRSNLNEIDDYILCHIREKKHLKKKKRKYIIQRVCYFFHIERN